MSENISTNQVTENLRLIRLDYSKKQEKEMREVEERRVNANTIVLAAIGDTATDDTIVLAEGGECAMFETILLKESTNSVKVDIIVHAYGGDSGIVLTKLYASPSVSCIKVQTSSKKSSRTLSV